jgi:outer membrane protein OmpA-like peptidoglycan-associated protein
MKLFLLSAVAIPLAFGSATVTVTPAFAQSMTAQEIKQARRDATRRLKQAKNAVRKAEQRLRQATRSGEGIDAAQANLEAANQELQAAEDALKAAMGNQPSVAEQAETQTEQTETTPPESTTAEEPSRAEELEKRRAERLRQRQERDAAREAEKAEREAQAAEEAAAAAEKQLMEEEERRKRRAERRKRLREQQSADGEQKPEEIIKESEAVGTELDDRQERQVERLRRKLREQRQQIRDLEQAQTEADEEVVRRTRDGRTIVRQDDQLIIRQSDDNDRFLRRAHDVQVEDLPRGRTRTTITRPDGTQIVTIRNRRGDIVYRVRIRPNGREIVLIDNRNYRREPGISLSLNLPRLVVPIPRDEYIVDLERADRRRLRETLIAPPVEPVERVYTLEEIRQSERLRDKVRRIDLDTVTFDTGSAEISPSQVLSLAEIGYAMEDVLIENPDAVFLVEGHTDAVGSEYYNLELSDSRAESVAIVLSENFDIPPENLITQGYGEEFLKIPTSGPERANRRVTIRPITDLIRPQSS